MIYFTSDWHIGHQNILKLCNRPFNDVYHMNEAIISNYQSVITDHDVVYFVGDIAWNYQSLPGILQRLPGIKHLIVGNHDKCFKELHTMQGLSPGINLNIGRYTEFYLRAGFMSVSTYQSVVIHSDPPTLYKDGMSYDNQTYQVLLSHFPYRLPTKPTEYDDRYWDMRLQASNAWLIHGHTHDKQPLLHHGNQINVSVEATNYKPISEYEISAIIKQQTGETRT